MKQLTISILILFILANYCFGYQQNSHIEITGNSINISERFIVSKLSKSGVAESIDENILEGGSTPKNPRNIRHLIQNGGYMEDEPFRELRFKNHFYSPTTNAGLNDYFNGLSSYGWANDASNNWSWQSAHTNYLIGLTAPTKEERNASLALAFRSLGQVMHLLQDKAVPAHVRNDIHPSPDPYEVYVEGHLANFIGTPIYYNGVLGSGETVPVQLWDSGRYNGTNPLFTLTPNIGLSEYTNANFASKDTIFTENYLIDEDPFNDRHYLALRRREWVMV